MIIKSEKVNSTNPFVTATITNDSELYRKNKRDIKLETSIIKTISAATFTLSTIDEDLKDFLPVEGSTTLYLKETKVPEGYTADTEIYKITIHIEIDEENNKLHTT